MFYLQIELIVNIGRLKVFELVGVARLSKLKRHFNLSVIAFASTHAVRLLLAVLLDCVLKDIGVSSEMISELV